VSDAINPALAEALKSEAVVVWQKLKHNSTMWMRTNGRKRLAQPQPNSSIAKRWKPALTRQSAIGP